MTKKSFPLNALLWVLALAWVGVLFYLSGQNAQQSSELSGWFADLVLRVLGMLDYAPANFEQILRKVAHFGIFAIEGFLLGLALLKSLPGKWFAAPLGLGACVVMAVANEYHQSFSDGRSCELRDMLIDSAGALLGVVTAALLLWLIGRIYRKRNVII